MNLYNFLRTLHFKLGLNSKARIKIHGNARKGRGTYIYNPTHGEYGDNFYIGRYSTIECDAIIGDNVIIGNNVGLVASNDHGFEQSELPMRKINRAHQEPPITDLINIEKDVWIGHGATVVGSLSIAQGSVIAAGAVLTKSTEPYSIYAGVPAVKVRSRFSITTIENEE